MSKKGTAAAKRTQVLKANLPLLRERLRLHLSRAWGAAKQLAAAEQAEHYPKKKDGAA